LNGWKSGSFVNFSQFPYSCIWIRIRIQKTDPDPNEETGVGAAIAAGSQAERGNCVLLVEPAKINRYS